MVPVDEEIDKKPKKKKDTQMQDLATSISP
jgi:hypothetical protein